MAGDFAIKPGLRGYLITCFKNREAVTTKEAYSFFEKFENEADKSDSDEQIQNLSVEDALKLEVSKIKDRKRKTFLALKINQVPCMVFISSLHILPPSKILEELQALEVSQTKYIQRIIPLDVICFANIKDIQVSIKGLLDEYFGEKEEKPTYSIIIEQRMNSSIVKSVLIQMIGEFVGSRGMVDLKRPKLVIMVQVVKNITGISIIRNYYERNKLNFNKK
jgi:tRNA acetyltransferase TAN1